MTNEQDKLTTADMAYGKEGGTTDTEERRIDGGHEDTTIRDVQRPEGVQETDTEPLLPQDQTGGYRQRWDSIQARFVDEPRDAVQEADTLVAEVIQQLAQKFADARQKLEGQWGRGDDVSTEDLRVALQQYRSFFNRLLSA